MNELSHLDLCSGIGGFSLAAHRAGFRTVGFSEVEPYACRVLAERFPGVPNIGDVRQAANFVRFRGCTVISAGYPCQPASLAGKRRGESDDRWLWPAVRDVVATVRPTWGIYENVFGHVSMGLDGVLADLETIGYAAQPFVVPACAVDAHHRRDRVWVVAHSDGGRGRTDLAGRHDTDRADAGRPETDGLLGTLCDAGRTADVANAECLRESQPERCESDERRRFSDGGQDVANTKCRGQSGSRQSLNAERSAEEATWEATRAFHGCSSDLWSVEPDVGRVAHGVSNRAHRLKGLGNSIVPQIAEVFFRFIAQIERCKVAP